MCGAAEMKTYLDFEDRIRCANCNRYTNQCKCKTVKDTHIDILILTAIAAIMFFIGRLSI